MLDEAEFALVISQPRQSFEDVIREMNMNAVWHHRIRSTAGRTDPTRFAGDPSNRSRAQGFRTDVLAALLAPPRRLVKANSQRRLADNLVRQHGIGGMESSATHVAIQPLQLARLEHPTTTSRGQRQVDHSL